MSTADMPFPIDSVSSGAGSDIASERARFESAVTPLMPDLVKYFVRRVEPTADAADCAAETTLAMWRHRRRLPSVAEEQRAWAFGVARNILANHHRKRVRRSLIDDSLRSTFIASAPEISDEAYAATQALKLLPAGDQELIRLVVWDGFSIAGAGQILGLRAATARKRYERARNRLRAHMQSLWSPEPVKAGDQKRERGAESVEQ